MITTLRYFGSLEPDYHYTKIFCPQAHFRYTTIGCVYVLVYIFVFVYVYIFVYVFVHVYIFVYVFVYVYLFVYVCVFVYVRFSKSLIYL